MFGFEKLEVWQRTRNFVKEIFKVTSEFPSKEYFGLTQHIRRSAVSILSNIAEGTSRFSKEDFRRFLQLSLGSLYETVSQLFIALDNEYINQAAFEQLYAEAGIIAKMISKLSKSQRG